MWTNILLSLFGLYTTIKSQTIVFNTTDIQCNEVYHPYNKYHEPLCIKWRQSLIPYFQKVHCVIASNNNNNEIYSGCSPSFGGNIDNKIHTEYILSKKCVREVCYNDQYNLVVNVKLNNPVHPIYNIICCIVMIGMSIFYILNPDYRFPLWYGRHFGNRNRHQVGWNRMY
jgi:hypothetical protein